jgi:salicylate hydroxylase
MNELLEDLKGWPEAVKDAVGNSIDITYLKRLQPKSFGTRTVVLCQGRCALLGDAAHPLTPHSGQGANQAFCVYPSCLALLCFSIIQELTSNREDSWHLAHILPSFESTTNSPPATPPAVNPMSSSELKAFFEAFDQKRQPCTTAIMEISRGVGDMKCPTCPKAEKRRDEYFRQKGFIAGALPTIQDDWFSQPF